MKIPVSQLAQQYHHHVPIFDQRRAALEECKAQSTKRLRDLIESVEISRARVDKFTRSIDASYSKVLLDWEAQDLALVLTGLDCRLLSLLKADFQGIDDIIDFHSYLQVIIKKEIVNLQSSDTISKIELLIKAAFFSVYVYRNLCSGYSMISVIHDAIQRGNMGSKLETSMKMLELHLHEICSSGDLEFDMLYHHQRMHEMTVIPNLIRIKKELKEINSACIIHSSEEIGMILSESGQKSLQKMISMVECCQGKIKLGLELSKKDSKYQLPKLKMPIPKLETNDLRNLGMGDLVLEHWLLTRVLSVDDQNYVAH